MSLTLIIWLLLFCGLLVASVKRPVYAVSLYMLTFFLLPGFWWWGDSISEYRWNFISGLVLLVAAALCPAPAQFGRVDKVLKISLAILLNATLVNFLIAGNSEESYDSYNLVIKFFLLMYLMFRTVRTVSDLQIVMMSILLGAAYIGYEATINERGDLVNNRLEGVGAPGASTANHFASLMVAILPLAAPFFLVGRTWTKVLVVCSAPMVVNVVLLCNSRGAFLAAIASAVVFICASPKLVRKKAIKIVAVGAVGVFFLLGDTRIVDRFLTTFAAAEERDRSAQTRIEYSKAGLEMVKDHPFGAGGHGFKKVHGEKYLQRSGASDVARSIHNGYINETCEWGIQGFVLRMLWFYIAMRLAFEFTRNMRKLPSLSADEEFLVLTQVALLSGLSAFLITYLFGDQNSSEWGYWLVALIMATAKIQTEFIQLNSRVPSLPGSVPFHG